MPDQTPFPELDELVAEYAMAVGAQRVTDEMQIAAKTLIDQFLSFAHHSNITTMPDDVSRTKPEASHILQGKGSSWRFYIHLPQGFRFEDLGSDGNERNSGPWLPVVYNPKTKAYESTVVDDRIAPTPGQLLPKKSALRCLVEEWIRLQCSGGS